MDWPLPRVLRSERVEPGYVRAPFWPYPVALAALMAMCYALGELVDIDRETETDSLDYHVWAWIVAHRDRWPSLTHLARLVTRLGNPGFATPAVLLIVAILFVLQRRDVGGLRRGEPWFWLLVAGGGRVLSVSLKLWFRRSRPLIEHRLVPETSFSFPSGHSVFAALFFTLASILLARSLPARLAPLRPVIIGLFLATALLVAASRVWLGVHYLTDVVGGFLLGLFWALAACAIRFGWVHLDRLGRDEASGGGG